MPRKQLQKNTNIILFEEKEIRKVWKKDRWYFSIIDIVAVLSESSNPRRYWSDLKIKIKNEGYSELYENIVQLKLESSDGKKYLTDTADLENMFRIIQSIPSPKAEPFKRWLAKVGKERIDEISDPELAVKRAKEIYRKKGYPQDWIEKWRKREDSNLWYLAARRFSRPLHSTTLPRFQIFYFANVFFNKYLILSLPFPLFKNNSSRLVSVLLRNA